MDVEVEDVADGRDIEAARRDVARDQKRDLAVAKTVESPEPRMLVHVAVQRADRIAVAFERAVERRHVALAIAEDDRVSEVRCAVDQPAERIAFFVRRFRPMEPPCADRLYDRRIETSTRTGLCRKRSASR